MYAPRFAAAGQEQFESRHDLYELGREAGFFERIPATRHEEFGAAFSLLNERWRSTQRYLSPNQLWRYLSDIGAERRQKGDPGKNHSRATLELALKIINLGDAIRKKWKAELKKRS